MAEGNPSGPDTKPMADLAHNNKLKDPLEEDLQLPQKTVSTSESLQSISISNQTGAMDPNKLMNESVEKRSLYVVRGLSK